jgi:peptidoglycan/LPS O-acetylase OafA/YrhL
VEHAISADNRLLELERATSTHTDYIDALTGLRGLAACWVLLFHLWMAAGPRKIHVYLFDQKIDLTPLFSGGWIGVDIFFVLSGFLLAIPYLRWHFFDKSPVSLPRYFQRRLLRVLPAYYAQILVLLGINLLFSGRELPDTGSLISHGLMIHNLWFEYNGDINRVYWTLPIEFGFYLLLPLLMLWATTPRKLLGLFVISTLISISYRYGAFQWAAEGTTAQKQWILNQLPGRLNQFVSGMVAAYVYLRLTRLPNNRFNQWLSRLGFIIGTGGILYLLYFFTGGMHRHFWQGHWSLFVWYSAAGAVISLLVLGLTLNHGWISRLFGNPLMLFLGLVSYSLYLWHYPIIEGLAHTPWIKSIDGYRLPWLGLIGMSASILAAALSYYLVERPFLLVRKNRNRGIP